MASEAHERFIVDRLASLPKESSLDIARQDFEELMARYPAKPDTDVSSIVINHMATDWVAVQGVVPQRTILYLHGGAYMLGSPLAYRGFTSRVSEACRARVLVPDYRLTPEHPYPAALEDAVEAYRWLLDRVSVETLVLIGDSAGGGLSVALLIALREQGLPLPACTVLYSPWTDLTCVGKSMQPGEVDDPFFTPEGVQALAQLYAGDKVSEPGASPLLGDLSGLPPMLVFAGTREILFDDATRLVDRARAAGVSATLEVGEGMIHTWPVYDFPESKTCLKQTGAFVDNVLN